MVGTAVVALFTTFGSSVKASIDDMVDDSFGGDLVIAQTTSAAPASTPALAPAIGELPEVAGRGRVVARRPPTIDGATVDPMATDPAALAAVLDLEVTERLAGRRRAGEIAISTRYADDHDLAHRATSCR